PKTDSQCSRSRIERIHVSTSMSYRRWKGFSYTKWLPAKTRDSDGYWSSQCTYTQGTLERWRGTNFSFRIGSALRSKNEIPGS
mgnify:CR=1